MRRASIQPHPGNASTPRPSAAPGSGTRPPQASHRIRARGVAPTTVRGQMCASAPERGAFHRSPSALSQWTGAGTHGLARRPAGSAVGHALALLHGRPAHPWTLARLARAIGVSRSALADRFTQFVGQPPMRYLGRWRMQLAAGLLSDGAAKVSAVARDVGYDSEAAFSRAFKKIAGVSPAAWREGPATATFVRHDGEEARHRAASNVG